MLMVALWLCWKYPPPFFCRRCTIKYSEVLEHHVKNLLLNDSIIQVLNTILQLFYELKLF